MHTALKKNGYSNNLFFDNRKQLIKETLCFGFTDHFPCVMFALAVSPASAGRDEKEGKARVLLKTQDPQMLLLLLFCA